LQKKMMMIIINTAKIIVFWETMKMLKYFLTGEPVNLYPTLQKKKMMIIINTAKIIVFWETMKMLKYFLTGETVNLYPTLQKKMMMIIMTKTHQQHSRSAC